MSKYANAGLDNASRFADIRATVYDYVATDLAAALHYDNATIIAGLFDSGLTLPHDGDDVDAAAALDDIRAEFEATRDTLRDASLVACVIAVPSSRAVSTADVATHLEAGGHLSTLPSAWRKARIAFG